MPTRDEILDDLTSYTTEQLVNFIKAETITIDDVFEDPDFSLQRRVELEKALEEEKNKAEAAAEKAWQECNKRDVDALRDYIRKFPDSPHVLEAKKRIDEETAEKAWQECNKMDVDALGDYIKEFPDSPHVPEAKNIIDELEDPTRLEPSDKLHNEIVKIQDHKQDYSNPTDSIINLIDKYVREKNVTSDDILNFIKRDHNIFNSAIIIGLVGKGIIKYRDLENIKISKDFLKMVKSNARSVNFTMPDVLIHLQNRPCTEVYFWGIPSSGKTCALGAILSVAQNGKIAKTMIQDYNCQGYDYMNRLSQLFQTGKVNVLPSGTPENAIYEMGFTLTEYNNDKHPITCIDLAGELFRFMYTKENPDLLQTLNNIFQSNKGNRKMHFFVIEYGAENRMYEDLPQRTYLDTAVNYLEKQGLFDQLTDGIYIIVTKADKADKADTEKQGRRKVIDKYLKEQNYSQFYNRLLGICQEKQINGGQLGVIPFSLGDVCFGDLCRFDDADATVVVQLLLHDTGTDGPSNPVIRKIWKIFKG